MVGVLSDILGGVLDLATSEELLGVAVLVENDTKGGSHVDGLTLAVPVDVLLGVGASVAVNVLELVSSVRLILVDLVMVVGFSNLANPGTDSHELLTLSLLDFEEVALGTVFVLAFVARNVLAGCLVEPSS